ncbi:aldo/keto reductase [Clostridia bacterium]|nr:aldo/keto reductase [Clostridia bacterium]
MEKRKMKNVEIETSLLGFGCMRFPTNDDGTIERVKAAEMLDLAIKNGVNYIDTAYPYHDGESELFVGEALKKYQRESYYLATKLPVWLINSLDDAKRIFEEQLVRLQKDYFDFYLIHSLNRGVWKKMLDLGVVDYVEDLKREGKIKYVGFSFHDEYPAFEEIVNYELKNQLHWDFCQIQLNFVDIDFQAGKKGYEVAKSLGIPVVIMEPVKGGSLASLPDEMLQHYKNFRPNGTAAELALRWVGSLDGVNVLLSGMSTLQQVQENLATFNNFEVLTSDELAAVDTIREEMFKRVKNSCTACHYCMPCPVGVDIPYNFRIWNDWGLYKTKESIRRWGGPFGIVDTAKAKNCIECGKCEAACPQGIAIREDLKRAQNELDCEYTK